MRIVIEIVRRWWEQDYAHTTIISRTVVQLAKRPLKSDIEAPVDIIWRKINLFRSILSVRLSWIEPSMNKWMKYKIYLSGISSCTRFGHAFFTKVIRLILYVSKLTTTEKKKKINKKGESRDCIFLSHSIWFFTYSWKNPIEIVILVLLSVFFLLH